MSVTITVRTRAHGPEGTANRLHREIKALLESLGYTLDGAMTVRVEPDRSGPYPSNTVCCCGDLIHPDMPSVELQPDGRLFHWNAEGGGHSADADSKYPT